MADIAVDDTLFGAPGVSDPIVFEPGLTGIQRKVDFAATNTGTANYTLFGLPKAFVVTGAFIEETEKCSAGTLTLKTKGGTTVMAAVTVGSDELAREAKQLATAAVLNEGDVVALTPSAAMTQGVVNIVVYGYQPYGDSLGNVVTPVYREVSQSMDNVGALDPHHGAAQRTIPVG